MTADDASVTGRQQQRAMPLIVGMGGAADGLEAMQQFFACIPGNSGLAFVVAQPCLPGHQSLMAEGLGRYATMPVFQAENGMVVEPDTVYVIPPGMAMSCVTGRLLCADCAGDTCSRPVDTLFASLAEKQRERALVVVLSGTGTDGADGIRAVKEHGGLVLVQDPDSTRFDGMPRSAIATGFADVVLSPRELAGEILGFSRCPSMAGVFEGAPLLVSDEDTLAHIYMLLKQASGIDLTYYKRHTVLRRIERRMAAIHCPSLEDFVSLLEENEEEAGLLVKDILIGVTRFFRDPAYFEKLKDTAIRGIVEHSDETEPIRVWSAGCSTGEEAYSLAMLFQEVLEEKDLHRDIKIFATDVNVEAIEQAGRGVFSENIAEDITAERLAKYFVKRDGQYQISKDIRRMIVFAPHNMLSDPPFGKLALICCRNVLIYFQTALQKGLFAIFHSALKNEGYLFLGKGETAGEYGRVFLPLSAEEKIYVHRSDGKMDLLLPVYDIPDLQAPMPNASDLAQREESSLALETVYTRFLEKFLPASVVIDEQDNIIHFFGNYADYLNIAPGKATLNFFSLVIKDLSLVSSTAIRRCRAEGCAVTYTGICVESASGRRAIDLSVQPVSDASGVQSGLLAVLFVEQRTIHLQGLTEQYDINATAARRIVDLERDLQTARSDLRTTINELEAVNEELQAANEELLTTNEELQSSNSELQSVNSELHTVNAAFRQKLDELSMMANDLSNFLASTMIGILFVDSRLNIRKFTEYIGREFNLLSQDVDRSMQIFARSFPEEDIVGDAQNVLTTLVSVDREVAGMNGRRYTMRIAPYRTTENSVCGLVITVIDSLGAERENSPGAPDTSTDTGRE